MFSEFSFIIVITVIIYNKATVMFTRRTRESELLLLPSAGTYDRAHVYLYTVGLVDNCKFCFQY